MRILSAVTRTLQSTLPASPPLPHVDESDLTTVAPRPSRADLLLRPARCRYPELQDYAARLARAMQMVILIFWGMPASHPTHLLLTRTPDGHWHAAVQTEAEIAHWLHALGMHLRATQRRHHRQQSQRPRRQEEDHGHARTP
jgi:hypothetical protein